jgi:HD-GYP domain-containing protein (c-di-GMP phosphodiesterase class II)
LKTSQRARTASRRFIFLCGAIPVIVTAVLALYRPSFFSRLDDAVYDTLLRIVRTKPPDGRVVIVDVDERSLSSLGQWPWGRDVMGHLVARLQDMGASTIALDILFAESGRDRSAGQTTNVGEGSPDAVFAGTLARGRVVMGYALTFDPEATAPGTCVLHPLGLAIIQPREESSEAPFFGATSAVCNLAMLARAAGASGFLNAAPDSDGILRRVPLLVELDGRVYPGLALAAVTMATGTHATALRISNVNTASLILDNRKVPLDGKSNLLLRYRGKKNTFRYVSAADVLSGHVPTDTFRDRVVFVGATALGTREVVATPLDTLFTGVEVQATVADNLLQQDFIRRPELETILESLAVLVVGVVVALVLATTRVLWGSLAGAAIVGALWCGAVWLLSTKGLFLSPLLPTTGVASALAFMTLAQSTVEGRRAERAGLEKTSAQQLMVQSLLSLTEVRDAETGRHSRRTQEYARLLANQLSTHSDFHGYLTPERIALLASLAPLHDIGKVGVPDRILNKPGALTAEELAEMRKHPVYGRDVILKAEQHVGVRDDAILAMAKDIVYTHHERWDGTGYPQGLRGADIPVAGRLMALVDVYDAAVTRNVYRPSIPHERVVEFIVAAKGAHFDPAVVDAFVHVSDRFKDVSREPDR